MGIEGAFFRAGFGAVAQVAGIIAAPAFNAAAGYDRARELFTRPERDGIAERSHSDWTPTTGSVAEAHSRSNVCANSEIAVFIFAPRRRTIRSSGRTQRNHRTHREQRDET